MKHDDNTFKHGLSTVQVWDDDKGLTAILAEHMDKSQTAYISNDDAPAVALAILVAAGYEPAKYQVAIDQQDPAFAALVLSNAVLKAEEARKAAAHNKRRDELALELSENKEATYARISPVAQVAIDRIIKMEARS